MSTLKITSIHTFVNPHNYLNFAKFDQKEILDYSLKKFFKATDLIKRKPEIDYASVCSGGVDSSLGLQF